MKIIFKEQTGNYMCYLVEYESIVYKLEVEFDQFYNQKDEVDRDLEITHIKSVTANIQTRELVKRIPLFEDYLKKEELKKFKFNYELE